MKNYKKVIGILIMIFMLSNMMLVSFAGGWDVSSASSWAQEGIEVAFSYDLVTSKVQGEFQKNITRAEFASLVIRLYENMTEKIAEPAPNNTFIDTEDIDVLKAYNLGIVSGKGDGIFAPNELVTREQMAIMYYKALEAIYKNAGKTLNSTDGILTIKDKSEVASWATKYVDFVYENRIIVGSNGNFIPKGNATRQEAIIVVKRVYEKYKEELKENKEKPKEDKKESKEDKVKKQYTIGNFDDETINNTYIDYSEAIAVVMPNYTGKNLEKGLSVDSYDLKEDADNNFKLAILGKIEDLTIRPVYCDDKFHFYAGKLVNLGARENEILTINYKQEIKGINVNPDKNGPVQLATLDRMTFDVEYKVKYPSGHKEKYKFTILDYKKPSELGPYIAPYDLPF